MVAAIPLGSITAARWSGLGGQMASAIRLLDAFVFDDGGLLAIVEVTVRDGAADDGAVREGAEPVRLTIIEGTRPPWPGLHRLLTLGGTVPGLCGGRLDGSPALVDGAKARRRGESQGVARALTGDQSHTSVVIEGCVVKLYRRLPNGPNPEAGVLAALARQAGAPVPAWVGSVTVTLPDGFSTAVTVGQAFVPNDGDAFEILAEGLAGWFAGRGPRVGLEIPTAVGEATGRLHVCLATADGPDMRPRPATAEERAAWFATAESGAARAVEAVARVDPGLSAKLASTMPAVLLALGPLADTAIPVMVQRTHGDLHLGQVLPTRDGALLIDFEGDPTRRPEDRGLPAPALRDVATFLRSIDHVARSGFRRAGAAPGAPNDGAAVGRRDAWIGAARTAFLQAYAAGSNGTFGSARDPLLRALEVEKELAEFVYAASFLPAWLYAPTAAFGALMDVSMDPEGRP